MVPLPDRKLRTSSFTFANSWVCMRRVAGSFVSEFSFFKAFDSFTSILVTCGLLNAYALLCRGTTRLLISLNKHFWFAGFVAAYWLKKSAILSTATSETQIIKRLCCCGSCKRHYFMWISFKSNYLLTRSRLRDTDHQTLSCKSLLLPRSLQKYRWNCHYPIGILSKVLGTGQSPQSWTLEHHHRLAVLELVGVDLRCRECLQWVLFCSNDWHDSMRSGEPLPPLDFAAYPLKTHFAE